MKLRDKKDLRGKTKKELWDLLEDKREKLSSLKVELSQNKLKNTRQTFNLRKEIATILTFLKEMEFTQLSEEKQKEKAASEASSEPKEDTK
ncbi:MAG: 50S ribosomal protein L29 [Patescibacteria group bacterium]